MKKSFLKSFLCAIISFIILVPSHCAVFAVDGIGAKEFVYFSGKSFADFAQLDFTEVQAQSAMAINLETGNVIYEKNSKNIIYPASTVKLMTAIIVLENVKDLNEMVYASENAVKISAGTRLNPVRPIKAGEGLTVYELLCGLLIPGANDAANVLAEHVGGSVESFCDMMNKRAKELGANDTVFKNPTGLHAEGMVTTAYDMAIIASHAYFINDIVKISSSTNYTLEGTNKTPERRYLYNRNRMIRRVEGEENYFFKGTLGMSAGSTPEGGNCVIAASKKNGLTYLTVVMGADGNDKQNFAYSDTISLLKTCFDSFSIKKVASGGTLMHEVPVTLATNTDHLSLFAKDDITALLPNTLDEANDIEIKKQIYKDARAPVKKGDKYGELSVIYKDTFTLGTTDLVAGSDIERSGFLFALDKLSSFFKGRWFRAAVISALVLFLIYCFLYYKAFRNRRTFRR